MGTVGTRHHDVLQLQLPVAWGAATGFMMGTMAGLAIGAWPGRRVLLRFVHRQRQQDREQLHGQ
jgi:hypothetical protein